jgi:hypothetical protein
MTLGEAERIVAVERLAESSDVDEGAGGDSLPPTTNGGSLPPPSDLN